MCVDPAVLIPPIFFYPLNIYFSKPFKSKTAIPTVGSKNGFQELLRGQVLRIFKRTILRGKTQNFEVYLIVNMELAVFASLVL